MSCLIETIEHVISLFTYIVLDDAMIYAGKTNNQLKFLSDGDKRQNKYSFLCIKKTQVTGN